MKENNFNFLRLYAAVGVLMGHVSWHMGKPFLGYEDGPLKPFFHLGVPFFFVVSGFFIYGSYIRLRHKGGSVSDFYLKRFSRIAPSIYFYIIFVLLLLFSLGAITTEVFTDKSFYAWMVSHLSLLPVYNPETFNHIGIGVLNGSLWTIAVMVMFYAAVPLIYAAEKKFGFNKTMIMLFVISILSTVSYSIMKEINSQFYANLFKVTLFPNLLFFSLGILWSRVWVEEMKKPRYFFLSLVVVLIFKTDVSPLHNYLGELSTLVWSLPFSFAIVWFGYHGPKIFRAFNRIEDIGMGIYIWHMVVINTLIYVGFSNLEWAPNFIFHLVVLSLTVIMAIASRYGIEKPAIIFLDREIKGTELTSRES